MIHFRRNRGHLVYIRWRVRPQQIRQHGEYSDEERNFYYRIWVEMPTLPSKPTCIKWSGYVVAPEWGCGWNGKLSTQFVNQWHCPARFSLVKTRKWPAENQTRIARWDTSKGQHEQLACHCNFIPFFSDPSSNDVTGIIKIIFYHHWVCLKHSS